MYQWEQFLPDRQNSFLHDCLHFLSKMMNIRKEHWIWMCWWTVKMKSRTLLNSHCHVDVCGLSEFLRGIQIDSCCSCKPYMWLYLLERHYAYKCRMWHKSHYSKCSCRMTHDWMIMQKTAVRSVTKHTRPAFIHFPYAFVLSSFSEHYFTNTTWDSDIWCVMHVQEKTIYSTDGPLSAAYCIIFFVCFFT